MRLPLAGALERLLPPASVCILSDYGKGTLSQVAALIGICRRRGVPVLVDPKGTDFARYRGATVLTPNLAEFEAVVGKARTPAELAEQGEALREALDLQALVITLGERGMAVIARRERARVPPGPRPPGVRRHRRRRYGDRDAGGRPWGRA